MTVAVMAAISALALAVNAQDNNQSPGGPPDGGAGGGGQRMGGRPPMPAIIKALDKNGDGVIDADEIANASTALKALDKNGAGKLTRDELMPPRPDGKQGFKDGSFRKHRKQQAAPSPSPSPAPTATP